MYYNVRCYPHMNDFGEILVETVFAISLSLHWSCSLLPVIAGQCEYPWGISIFLCCSIIKQVLSQQLTPSKALNYKFG